ncbi:hypothetical protein CWATWH0005_1368 [Crocosphaera watsonii WH 0005]|uniref:Uncharacterized protein n=1 Tax=Crocosphaera watsonii WH 0005 TaxID=423472 RepID=T2IPQ7_CROWT|nr:hypothetical protein CWATWH0005_1368 [Crocosphaera watsonii WH 0005]
MVLYWLLWVTKQLNKNHKLMIQTYQGSIQKLEPSSSENHPKAWEKLINWKESPLDSKPKAAIVGHISGKNCAEIILTVGFITEEYFILYAHNPNNAPVENIDLDVEIIAII